MAKVLPVPAVAVMVVLVEVVVAVYERVDAEKVGESVRLVPLSAVSAGAVLSVLSYQS